MEHLDSLNQFRNALRRALGYQVDRGAGAGVIRLQLLEIDLLIQQIKGAGRIEESDADGADDLLG